MPAMYDYEEMVILRLLELNSLIPHYWSEFMILAFQLLGDEEQKILKSKIDEIESLVLEKEFIKNYYKCVNCKFKFKTRIDWFDMTQCPKCESPNIKTVLDRQSLYDIEMAMESNRDYGAFFLKYGSRITKFDIERKLNRIKQWIFNIIRQRAQQRRFKRFR